MKALVLIFSFLLISVQPVEASSKTLRKKYPRKERKALRKKQRLTMKAAKKKLKVAEGSFKKEVKKAENKIKLKYEKKTVQLKKDLAQKEKARDLDLKKLKMNSKSVALSEEEILANASSGQSSVKIKNAKAFVDYQIKRLEIVSKHAPEIQKIKTSLAEVKELSRKEGLQAEQVAWNKYKMPEVKKVGYIMFEDDELNDKDLKKKKKELKRYKIWLETNKKKMSRREKEVNYYRLMKEKRTVQFSVRNKYRAEQLSYLKKASQEIQGDAKAAERISIDFTKKVGDIIAKQKKEIDEVEAQYSKMADK